MKTRLLPLLLAVLSLVAVIDCPQSLAESPISDDRDRIAVQLQIDDEGANLPDDPMDREPSGRKVEPKRTDAEFLPPLADHVAKKVRGAFGAIRDALHRSASRDGFDVPVITNDAIDRHIRCFTGPKRESFARWLVRAKKYEPLIKGILKKNGLPEDLVYMAMIESGFNMKACSRAGALGPWQFMDETGRRYGLRVDYWVDERYDLEKSTVAAARYLKNLFDEFGCWYLVAASYNAGENRVRKAVENAGSRDFWELRENNVLPLETREYVPQLIAAAMIAKNPEWYGFARIRPIPVTVLTKVSVPGGLPLNDVSRAFSVDPADLRALNPELLHGITPPEDKKYRLKLPGNERTRRAASKAGRGLRWERRVVAVFQHRVGAKDSFPALEKLYRVKRTDLALVNSNGFTLEKGGTLYVPRFAGRTAASPRIRKSATAVVRTATDRGKVSKKTASSARMASFQRKKSSLSTAPKGRSAAADRDRRKYVRGQKAAGTTKNMLKTVARKESPRI